MKAAKEGLALIVVDVQLDFCPGGALPVARGNDIVLPLNELIRLFNKSNFPVVFTRDWHPKNHCSFKDYGGTWPPHCVQNTKGAKFYPTLHIPKNSIIISKATNPKQEAYSGFQGTELARILRERVILQIFVGGLATDYCVKNTVIDAIKSAFTAYVLTDCVRGVNVRPDDSKLALEEMVSLGAKKVTSETLAKKLNRRVAVLSSS